MSESDACIRVYDWILIDVAPCIRILIHCKCKKVPLVLRKLNFQTFHLSITTAAISSPEFLIDKFKHLKAYESKTSSNKFLASEFWDSGISKNVVYNDLFWYQNCYFSVIIGLFSSIKVSIKSTLVVVKYSNENLWICSLHRRTATRMSFVGSFSLTYINNWPGLSLQVNNWQVLS